MSRKFSSRKRGMFSSAMLVGLALIAIVLVSLAGGGIRGDRQLPARELSRPSPLFVEPVGPGDTIADRELGQVDFFHNTSNFVDAQSMNPSASGLFNGIAIDQSSVPNRVYVADSANNRVLGWASVKALVNSKPADIVIGEPDFFTTPNPGGVSAASLSDPTGIAVDSSGNLYVADYGNSRVLEYNSPFAFDGTPGSGDTTADEVFGQADNFTSSTCNLGSPQPNAKTLCSPQGVALDSTGNLYIADTGNNRVLEYNFPSINTTANFVFGQGDNFSTNGPNNGGLSAASLFSPEGLALDSANNLYVADRNNSRVLEYKNPPTANRTNPRVFGQTTPNLGSCNNPSLNASSLCDPAGVALDGLNHLYVGDQGNNRVLEYNSPLTSVAANKVFGQAGFSGFSNGSCNNGTSPSVSSARTLCSPTGVSLDIAGDLFVMDTNNNRVLRYNIPLTTDEAANVVLGQPDFTHRSANSVDGSAMSGPIAVALDNSPSASRLYVADSTNNRVLGFNHPASFSNGAPADVVIGQVDLFSAVANRSGVVNALGLANPQAVAVDKKGNLYVVDDGNCRVLEFPAQVTTGKAAQLVIGQSSFSNTCSSPSISATTLSSPQGVAVDASGNLYVADTADNRVLEYNAPLASGDKADHVLGQPTFTTGDPNHGGLSATSLYNPIGLGISASGNLYVADRFNCRVLEYKLPLHAGSVPDKVFGQGSFSTNACNGTGSGQTELSSPQGVATDSGGDLYIADTSNNRILEYNKPLVSSQAANIVFGQAGLFTTMSANLGGTAPNAEGLWVPMGIVVDTGGNLYAADRSNNRVLQYEAPLAKPSPTPVPKPATVSPTTLLFGKVHRGSTSPAKQTKLTNAGTGAIVVNAVTRSGANRADFAQSNDCIGSLKGGGSCTISVTFTPSAAVNTAESATLTIFDSASNSPQKVTLTGTSGP